MPHRSSAYCPKVQELSVKMAKQQNMKTPPPRDTSRLRSNEVPHPTLTPPAGALCVAIFILLSSLRGDASDPTPEASRQAKTRSNIPSNKTARLDLDSGANSESFDRGGETHAVKD